MFFSIENDKIKANYIKQFIIYLSLINVIFYISLKIFYHNKFSPYSKKIIKLKVGDDISAKIGIISDFQLNINNYKPFYKYCSDNVYQALKVLKDNNIDILLIIGDITNNGESINYLHFKKIFYSVYNNIQKPIVISLMGNHDYKDIKFTNLENQNKFFNYMNSYPYSHFIINNYNFIFWSNDNQKINESAVEEYIWIKSTLENARKNIYKKGDPIFVFTHMPPMKTVYGSENIWGHQGIFDFLKNYPEVICISGHSHYSLKNIKSIWQGEFTVINTQSISYVDLDDYYQNCKNVRFDSAKNGDSMGLIAFLTNDKIIFDRIEFSTEEFLEESWEIEFPLKPANFKYQFEKRNKKVKPIFKDNNEIKIEKINKKGNNKNYIVFNAAYHEDYVYNYRILLNNTKNNNTKEYFYYSDYYKNKRFRANIIKYELPNELNKGKYYVEIYAKDSFDNESKPKVGIINL